MGPKQDMENENSPSGYPGPVRRRSLLPITVPEEDPEAHRSHVTDAHAVQDSPNGARNDTSRIEDERAMQRECSIDGAKLMDW